MNRPYDKLLVKDWKLKTYIGCLDWEKYTKQTLKIDLEFEINSEYTSRTDDVNDCVEYIDLTTKLRKNYTDRHHNLIEALAEKLASDCLKHPQAYGVRVTVKKSVLKSAKYASISIYRQKV